MFRWLFTRRKINANSSDDEVKPSQHKIPVQPPPGAEHDFVTIITCSTIIEADRAVRMLEQAGVPTQIPDKFGIAASSFADLRNCYPHIPIRIARKYYGAAREVLIRGGEAANTEGNR